MSMTDSFSYKLRLSLSCLGRLRLSTSVAKMYNCVRATSNVSPFTLRNSGYIALGGHAKASVIACEAFTSTSAE